MTERYTGDPFELELPWRIADFAEVAVHRFDAGAVASAATADPTAHDRLADTRGALWQPTLSMRAALTLVIVTVLVLASLVGVFLAGQQGRTFHLGHLAYVSGNDVYIANADGSDPRAVTHSVLDGRDYDVDGWSGDQLLFEGRTQDPDSVHPGTDSGALLTYDATTRQITELAPLPWCCATPVSGDASGDRFAIMESSQLTIVGADGSTVARLTPPTGYDRWDLSDLRSLSFSADGSALVASACTAKCMKGGDPGHDDLFLIRFDGQPPLRLTTEQTPAWHASLSPDGSQIAFDVVGPNDYDWSKLRIWVMDRDGSARRLLETTPGSGLGSVGSWSPDGRRILYIDRDQAFGIAPVDGRSPAVRLGIAYGNWVASWWPGTSTVIAANAAIGAADPGGTLDVRAFPADGSPPELLVSAHVRHPEGYARWQWIADH